MLPRIWSVSSSRMATRAARGTGRFAGRRRTPASVFENSRFVTGFGAAALRVPETSSFSSAQRQQPDLVVAVDPGHVLTAAGERPAGAELEHRQELLQEAAAGIEQEAGAEDGNPEPRSFRDPCGVLPLDDELREPAVPGLGLLVDHRLAVVAVVADGRLADQHARRHRGAVVHEVLGRAQAAVAHVFAAVSAAGRRRSGS